LNEEFDPARYPSFTLLLYAPEGGRRYQWFRRGRLEPVAADGEWQVYSSSGWDSEPVIQWREREFDKWLDQGAPMVDTLPKFHILRREGDEEKSPLMERSWSATRSITQAAVDRGAGLAELRYWPSPTPASGPPAAVLQSPLHRQSANPRTNVS